MRESIEEQIKKSIFISLDITSEETEAVTYGSQPIKQKTRGIPYNFREEFGKTIMEMKAAGMIVDSKSPWCSPVRLIRKKDGSIRICVDYRKVINVTVKDA